jgi:hypothetical protein
MLFRGGGGRAETELDLEHAALHAASAGAPNTRIAESATAARVDLVLESGPIATLRRIVRGWWRGGDDAREAAAAGGAGGGGGRAPPRRVDIGAFRGCFE